MPTDAFHLDVEAVTEAPLHVGGRLTFEGPVRLRVSTAVGVLPRPYLDGINAAAVEFGWYDRDEAELIGAALEDSLVWRTHLGWRPWADHGFFFTAGYGFIGLGGALTGTEVLTALYGVAPPFGDEIQVNAAAALHTASATVGWEWTVKRHFLVRAELGGSYTADAIARVEPDEETGFRFLDEPIERAAEDTAEWLEGELEQHVHTPTVGLGVGWRF